MPNFPKTEAEVISLAQSIINGMTNNPDFPSPPVTPAALQASLNSFLGSRDAQTAAYAAAEQSTDVKQGDYESMTTEMKMMLRYAEDAVHGDDSKLSALNWGARREKTPLAAPGQVRLLQVAQLVEGRLTLRWKKPIEGGSPSYYKIERCERTAGGWALAGTASITEITLTNQERGKELEYQIIAANRTGDGPPSNRVTVVL
jgi:hypothetical protein